MGNHAIARAIVESGTRVITSYPGSPTPEIGAALTSVPKAERSFYFEFSVNEKVALEIAAGASLNGHLSCVFFKSVGLNVASDSLIQQSLMNHIGGLVIVLGDDPGANSSQNEQDNRHFSRMSYIPMLEPASPKEAYELYLEAARISREKQMPVFLRLTTNVCHARQLVSFGGLIRDNYSWPSRYHRDNGPYFPVTKDVFPLKNNALKKLETLQSTANRLVRQYSADTRTGLGVISCGLPALETLEVSEAAGNKVSVLQLQMTWPLPKEAVLAFLSAHNEVVVIEELDRVMETEIKAMAFDAGCTVCIYSRPSSEIMGELSRHRILKILSSIWPDHFSASRKKTYETFTELPPRPPQLCPGCGHRSAFFAASDILDDTSIVVGDIGCLTLGALPPHHMGDILFSMGHSVSTAQGLALKNPSRNVLALMGDGTFFHAGIPGVINAVANQSNITLYLLDNATTAMTGHQSRPGNGEIGEKINIPALLKSLGVGFIRQADAYNQTLLKQYLQEAFEYDGFAVVIARHPCMLKLTRANRRKDPLFQLPPVTFSAPPDDVDEKRILAFGCPSFQRGPNGEMTVNEEMCIGCGACLPVSLSGVIQRGAPVRASGKER
ncbi:MAG: indolepyruvate ferredoxin oxidoreductase [Deltaproteobacteria bacterium]|nr:indolepyruvate ferredoxin oxidoreductase [Deltaproteobacteria bacterium]